MKSIEIDEELYQYIASKTEFIGESASSILRRLLALDSNAVTTSNSPVVELEVKSEAVKSSVPEKDTNVENHGSVFDHINKEELAMQRGAVGRFLLILAALHRVHADKFSAVCNIRGRDRLYFADSEKALAETGSSTKPRQIPESEYWVITNSNTTRKKMMLTEVAVALNYSASDAEKIRELL
ncbi:replication initiation negative regulator SeqA [Thalassotalea atypica]|uniref:replication initiation negative regulator SeqA n=1 Tax=Thalassotalea atypica TaxID=2054316 RepID=UPI002572BD77|nr:replication initiation negative regulator SeqA [Thalassotalea atypica]